MRNCHKMNPSNIKRHTTEWNNVLMFLKISRFDSLNIFALNFGSQTLLQNFSFG
jgi:hypothetical protein